MNKTNKLSMNEVTIILSYYFVSDIKNIFYCLVENVQTDNGNLMNQNEGKSYQWFHIQGGIVLSISFFIFDISLTGIKRDRCPQNRIHFSVKLLSIQDTSS